MQLFQIGVTISRECVALVHVCLIPLRCKKACLQWCVRTDSYICIFLFIQQFFFFFFSMIPTQVFVHQAPGECELPWLVISCWYGPTPVGRASVAAVAAALCRNKRKTNKKNFWVKTSFYVVNKNKARGKRLSWRVAVIADITKARKKWRRSLCYINRYK